MSLSISLNKPPGTPYMPGETIKGIVTVDMAGTCACESMTLTVQGMAQVELIVTNYYGGHWMHNEVCKANEVYVKAMINLLSKTTLARGRTVYLFEHPLPSTALPMSYVASHGSVDYEVIVDMYMPGSQPDLHEQVSFTMGAFLDLNRMYLGDFGPVHFEDQKSVEQGSCCASKKQSVGIQIIFPKRHFVPGELVQFTVITDNKCDLRVLGGTMELMMTVTCTAEGKSESYLKILEKMAGPEVAPQSLQTWKVKDFMIPMLEPDRMPPSGLGGCKIITADYNLQYAAYVDEGDDGCCDSGSEKLDAFVPIIIGTIPLNI